MVWICFSTWLLRLLLNWTLMLLLKWYRMSYQVVWQNTFLLKHSVSTAKNTILERKLTCFNLLIVHLVVHTNFLHRGYRVLYTKLTAEFFFMESGSYTTFMSVTTDYYHQYRIIYLWSVIFWLTIVSKPFDSVTYNFNKMDINQISSYLS